MRALILLLALTVSANAGTLYGLTPTICAGGWEEYYGDDRDWTWPMLYESGVGITSGEHFCDLSGYCEGEGMTWWLPPMAVDETQEHATIIFGESSVTLPRCP